MIRLLRPLAGPLEPIRLETPRLYLRPPAERDWRAWARIREESRDFLTPWEPTWPADALTREAFRRRLRRNAEEWREGTACSLLIFAKSGDALLGGITLSHVRRGVAQMASLGYWIGARHARRGYMTEALGAVIRFAFEDLGLHRLEAACLPTNAASERLLLKCGFRQEGFARRYLRIDGTWHDHLLFGLVREDVSAEQRAE